MKGDVDMSATTSGTGGSEPIGGGEPGFSGAELSKNIKQETEADIFIAEK